MTLMRKETQRSVCGYSCNLDTNEITAEWIQNKKSDLRHVFKAYRLKNASNKPVSMSIRKNNSAALDEYSDDE